MSSVKTLWTIINTCVNVEDDSQTPLWCPCMCSLQEGRWINHSRALLGHDVRIFMTRTGSVTWVISQLISIMTSLGAFTDCRAGTRSFGNFKVRTGPGSRVSLVSLFAKQVYSVFIISSEHIKLGRNGRTVFASNRDEVIFSQCSVQYEGKVQTRQYKIQPWRRWVVDKHCDSGSRRFTRTK